MVIHAEDALNIVRSLYRYVAIEAQSSVLRLSSLLYVTYAMLLEARYEKQERLNKIDSSGILSSSGMKDASSMSELTL